MTFLAVTPGEPAGIGPDIVLQTVVAHPDWPVVVVGDRHLLHERALQLGLEIPSHLRIQHIPLAVAARAGVLDPRNSTYVLECIRQAVALCQRGEVHALVTGPIHKGVINQAGIPFSGHTEFLAELTNTPLTVMLMVGESMRVALYTTHIPLSAVPAAIHADQLAATIRIIHQDMQRRFGIKEPRISVCGLNPHAGENGHFGREEIDIMTPTLAKLQEEGYLVQGPLPADTAFTPAARAQCDVILAMYHDQGLPVFKALNFSTGVNITLGLPIIRTSVDHGTALDLAGTGKAEFSSLVSAIELARKIS